VITGDDVVTVGSVPRLEMMVWTSETDNIDGTALAEIDAKPKTKRVMDFNENVFIFSLN
jgi:hypothetical protein